MISLESLDTIHHFTKEESILETFKIQCIYYIKNNKDAIKEDQQMNNEDTLQPKSLKPNSSAFVLLFLVNQKCDFKGIAFKL